MSDALDGRIPTNMRMLLILETFGQKAEGTTATEIGRAIGLPKQTVHRLCTTLLEQGFLVRDEASNGFRPGRRARRLATTVLQASSVHIARRQVLIALAEEIGETVNFVMPEDRGMSYKDRIETNWAFRIQLPVGSHVPFHCTASGKAFLASLPKSERRRLVNVMPLQRLTNNTHVSAETLLQELAQIARQGYALDNEEFMDGMVATSVPVFNASGKYFASLAFHGPVQRISIERAVSLAPVLQKASRKITTVLFGSEDDLNRAS